MVVNNVKIMAGLGQINMDGIDVVLEKIAEDERIIFVEVV